MIQKKIIIKHKYNSNSNYKYLNDDKNKTTFKSLKNNTLLYPLLQMFKISNILNISNLINESFRFQDKGERMPQK